jgi:hypothetical protein
VSSTTALDGTNATVQVRTKVRSDAESDAG